MSHHEANGSSEAKSRLVVLSGCSGGGKSTLIAALAARGVATVPEPGRRIVREQLNAGGSALPSIDMAAFARRALAVAIDDRYSALERGGLVVFDRGVVDAAAALERATGDPILAEVAARHPYASPVFLTPPWPEIYIRDADRSHHFDAAVAEYEHLLTAYAGLGYDVVLLPRVPVEERAAILLARLSVAGAPRG